MGQLLNIKSEVVHEWTQEEFDAWREANYDEESGLTEGCELMFWDPTWENLDVLVEDFGIDNETMRVWKA